LRSKAGEDLYRGLVSRENGWLEGWPFSLFPVSSAIDKAMEEFNIDKARHFRLIAEPVD
jgi:hypothetical protein